MSTAPRRHAARAATASGQQFAVFTLGSLEYAVDIMRITQIIRPLPVRPVPRAPEFIDGVIELRGAVIPVMDLRRRFGVQSAGTDQSVKFIIVRLGRRQLGLIVDMVVGVHRVQAEAIRPAPQWIAGEGTAIFSGVCMREGRLVLLIDLGKLVATDEVLEVRAVDPNQGGLAPEGVGQGATEGGDLDALLGGQLEDDAPHE